MLSRATHCVSARYAPRPLPLRCATPPKASDLVTRRQVFFAGVNAAALLAIAPTVLARQLQPAIKPRGLERPTTATTKVVHPAPVLPVELWDAKLGDVKEALAVDPVFIDSRRALLLTLLYRHPTIVDLEDFGPNGRYKFRYYEIDYIDGSVDVGPVETGLFTKSAFPGTNSGIFRLGTLVADAEHANAAIFLHRTAAGINGVTGQRYTLGGTLAPLTPAEALTKAQPFWNAQNGRYDFPIWGESSAGFTVAGQLNSTYSYFNDPTLPPNNQDELQLLGPQQQVLWRRNFSPYYAQVYGEQPAYFIPPNPQSLLAVHRSGVLSSIDRNSY